MRGRASFPAPFLIRWYRRRRRDYPNPRNGVRTKERLLLVTYVFSVAKQRSNVVDCGLSQKLKLRYYRRKSQPPPVYYCVYDVNHVVDRFVNEEHTPSRRSTHLLARLSPSIFFHSTTSSPAFSIVVAHFWRKLYLERPSGSSSSRCLSLPFSWNSLTRQRTA